LNSYLKEGDAFLKCNVTGDNSWTHHYAPESKCKTMEWKHPTSPVKNMFKTLPLAIKVMLTLFWDEQRPILGHYQERGRIVSSVRYREVLQNQLKPAIQTKY
jgi:hypothetical protein